ncbi:MAG: ABC transporter permease [Clostridiales bacterium]|nr:ABC transporter permease [Clostridiales bacterium]
MKSQNIAADSEARSARNLRNARVHNRLQAFLPLIGLLIIVAAFAGLTDGQIVTMRSVRLILSQVYPLMIASTGVFMVMTLGSLDFSQGSILGISSIVISWLSFYSIPLAIVGGILTGAAIGLMNGFFHVSFRIPSFIVTICTMYLFRGLCAYLTTDAPVAAMPSITALNQDWIKLAITAGVLLAAFLVFRFTRIGIDLKAIGAGELAARYSGVRTDLVKVLAFVAAGAITGIAAFVNVVKVGSITSTAGNQFETQILIALVLGGLPISGGAKVRFSNIIIGTLISLILNNGLVMIGLDTAMQQLIKGVIFLAVVALTIDRKSLKVIK